MLDARPLEVRIIVAADSVDGAPVRAGDQPFQQHASLHMKRVPEDTSF